MLESVTTTRKWSPRVCLAHTACTHLASQVKSCMRIDKQCVRENRALLGYLMQGNVRLLLVRDADGRTLVRAVARLLARGDTGDPVVFLDQVRR